MKKLLALLILLLSLAPGARASQLILDPLWPVPDYVTWLVEVAAGEVGYTEGQHGYTKYGEWAGDPYAQWCAEYLCWCVDQVDQRHGTSLLNQVYPKYSGTNVGRDWFIRQGRYVCRWGNVEGWGYQWLKGEEDFIRTGSYIPQPGDWIFFTWDGQRDTDHVAMVEYCARDEEGNVTIYALEGNAPSQVQRQAYNLHDTSILGFGTVHDVMDITMRSGCQGEKVRQLQDKLRYLNYLTSEQVDGVYGSATAQAVSDFQASAGLTTYGIANQATQLALDQAVAKALDDDPDTWTIVEDE